MKRDFRPGVGAETVVKRYVSEWFDVRAHTHTHTPPGLSIPSICEKRHVKIGQALKTRTHRKNAKRPAAAALRCLPSVYLIEISLLPDRPQAPVHVTRMTPVFPLQVASFERVTYDTTFPSPPSLLEPRRSRMNGVTIYSRVLTLGLSDLIVRFADYSC